MDIRDGVNENQNTINNIFGKLENSGTIIKELLKFSLTEGDFFEEINKENHNPEEAKYEIFGDESDMLISVMTSSQLKEIVNLIKVKALNEGPPDKKGNFVKISNQVVENDRIKSESELNEIKLKDLDRVLEITQKQSRIERKIAEFWRGFAIDITSKALKNNGSIYVHVLKETGDFVERDLYRYISKIVDEGIKTYVNLNYVIYKDDCIEFLEFPNSEQPHKIIMNKSVVAIQFYKDINILK